MIRNFGRLYLKRRGSKPAKKIGKLTVYMVEIEGVREIVESLKRQAYRLAILSNDSKEMFSRRRKRFGLDQLFHDIIVSSEYGVVKPHPEIYWIALKRMNVLPGRSLLIDDRLENTMAAKNIGMYTILFRNAEQTRKELGDLGICLS